MKVTKVKAPGVKNIGIIGAGAMFANVGIAVELLDIVGVDSRNSRAEAGVFRQFEMGGFIPAKAAALVRPGNINDHLNRLKDVDWVIEAVAEKLDVKRELFQKVTPYLKPSAIHSSQTSTISLYRLIEGMKSGLARRFAIKHFFNPPRQMPLLEIVTNDLADPNLRYQLHYVAGILLGKTSSNCHDTLGFAANRIGCFWIAVSSTEAYRLRLDIETADAVQTMFDAPKTGVLELFDLIGIDLVPTIWGSLIQALPIDDELQDYNLPDNPLIIELLEKGSLGRKVGCGFYDKRAGGQFEVLDIEKLLYRDTRSVQLPVELETLLSEKDLIGNYARSVFRKVVLYLEVHLSKIASAASVVDTAMELGYFWRVGPFELATKVAKNFEY